MSEDFQRGVKDIGVWAVRGVVAAAVSMIIFIANEMRASVNQISEDVKGITDIVIRLDEKAKQNREDIMENRDDIKRIEERIK